MPSLNIFIDGSWLFRVVAADGSLANATDSPRSRFPLDFAKLTSALLRHLHDHGKQCDGPRELVICTSIFTLPSDFETWPSRFAGITANDVDKLKRAVFAREQFVREAVVGGYSEEAVFHPPVREWSLRKLTQRQYQEKQVDTTVVALLVRAAITRGEDFHTVITGDSDILPAVSIAYPQFTRNVFVTTTHPDELNAQHRQTAYSLIDFSFDIPPFYMQNKENAEQLLKGDHVYRCQECGKIFATAAAVPSRQRPRCSSCRPRPAITAP